MATTGDVSVKAARSELPKRASKVVARISELLFSGYRDHVAAVGADVQRLAGCALFVTRCVVNSKFIPSDHEVDVIRQVLLDFMRLCNSALDAAQELQLGELIEEFRDQIRHGSSAWAPRG